MDTLQTNWPYNIWFDYGSQVGGYSQKDEIWLENTSIKEELSHDVAMTSNTPIVYNDSDLQDGDNESL